MLPTPKLSEVLPPRLPPHLLLTAVVSSAREAIISKSLEGTITSWNPAAEAIFGYTAEEAIGTSIFRLVPPELHAQEREILGKVRGGQRIENLESRRRRKDGSILFVSLSISPICDDSGTVIGASKIARDITEERATQSARALLAAIVDSSDDGIISKDLSGVITSWNKAATRIFGYEPKEIVGRPVLTLIPPEHQGEEEMILEQLRRGQRIDHFETIRMRKDGTRIQVSLSISPIADAAGNLVGASKIVRDITRQREAEMASRRLAAIVDSSNDAIIGKDLSGTITNWNAAATRMFGYQPDEIIGRSVLALIPPELHGDEPAILARLRQGERIEHFETTRVRKDGQRVEVSLTISPVRDPAGRLIGASKIARDITSQREGDAARRRLVAIVDSSDDAIVSKDLNGIVQSWNKGAERIFGYTAAEMVGKPITLLMRPQEALEEPAILEKIARGERIDHYETIRRRKDGSLIDVSLTISALRDVKGEVIGASKIARDVTRQRRLERERTTLLQQEQEARSEAEALMEAAKGLSADLDLHSAAQRATDIATRLTGAKFGAFFYNTVNERQESYVLYALSGAPREAFERFGLPRNTAVFGPTFKGEGVVRLADVTADPRYGKNAPHHGMPKGHLPVRSYLAVPVISRTGEVIGGMFFGHPDVGVFRERAERTAAGIAAQTAIAVDNARLYTRVQNAASRLNFSLAALELGDWTWNLATDEMRFSDRAAEIYGLPLGMIAKREALRERIHAEDRDRARALAAEAVRKKSDYAAEYRINHPTLGVRWVLAKGRSQLDEFGNVTGMSGVVQDITDRKRAEEQIQRHAEILEQQVAERTAKLQETIAELEAFSYSVSHDMRTPLRAMYGYADRLARVHGAKLDAEANHQLKRISENARRLEMLVRDVLAYSRVSKAEIELVPVELDKFLETLLPTIPELQKPDVVLAVQRPLPRVLAHEAYLSQVLTNLLGNATKFAAPGRPPRIEIAATIEGSTALVHVIDNGIGIAEEHFDRIFQIFGRVYPDKQFEGTGIGLSIVRKAVQRMGGQVAVQSKLGEGSRFTVSLRTA